MLLTKFESKFRDARNGAAYATGKMQGHESIDVTISVTDQKEESYNLLDVVMDGEFSCGCPSRIDFRIQRQFSAVEAETYHQAEEAECANMVLDELGVPRKDENATYSLVGRIQWLRRSLLNQPQENITE